ncbi:pyroglutamyl-peptidase I [Pseudoclavibacter alba]|uniref:pyroglutamyl-peptidase I n=1 Tax=Pseudoclavibacter albus TaxID=272241 RepID=UPI0019D30637|nr:pyroglutamyl-peptidase I [Pseudoclavibacter alba]MBN6777585.1 pyroglutamyl-peptidase I [Pseudoclavibacter alba]
MRILVTGFDPFDGESCNPSWDAVSQLSEQIAGAEIVTKCVPTEFRRATAEVSEAIDELAPDAVVLVGEAGGRADVTPERVAINLEDARIPDNAGAQPIDVPVADDGPAAYFSTLPVKAMVSAIRDAGLPASLSNSAGTFVCNDLMYGVLHYLAVTGRTAIRSGFVHVPFVPEQAARHEGTPSLPLDDIVCALSAAIEAVVTVQDDPQIALGTTH